MAGFDWYQATVPADTDDVIEAVFLGLEDGAHLDHRKGVQGYAHTTAIEGRQGTIGQVWHGGTHARPHVLFSGESAQAGAELLRSRFPEHYVTRADAREDFDGEGTFDRIQAVLLPVAQEHRVKVGTAGDHLLTKEGRTVYLGAASSACRLRLYDKAAELRAKFSADPVRLAEVPEHLTRLEAQVRPQTKDSRLRFASIEPVEVMGSSSWLRKVWHGVTGLELEPVQVGKPWRQSDDDRAYAYLLAQYGGLLARKAAEHGSWECLGLQIRDDLAERHKASGAR